MTLAKADILLWTVLILQIDESPGGKGHVLYNKAGPSSPVHRTNQSGHTACSLELRFCATSSGNRVILYFQIEPSRAPPKSNVLATDELILMVLVQ